MRIRVKFLPGKQKDFLSRVTQKSGLSIDELAKLAGVVPRSYRDWKREKLNMTLEATEKFSREFKVPLPEQTEIVVKRWFDFKNNISRMGGLALFRKHGSPATIEGRRKGGSKALKILRERGTIPLVKTYNLPTGYSARLAELVGILLGDGGINLGQACITLNREADKDYVNFVVQLEEGLFGEKPGLLERRDSKAINIYLNGVQLVKYLVRVGLKTGNKVRQQVDVPLWIKRIKRYRTACLRGLMDTDGGVFIHKYKVNGKIYFYKKICFSNRSLPLLYFVRDTLEELGFTPKMISKVENKKVWLYNRCEVERYLKLVGTHNSRLLKYQIGIIRRVVSNGKTQVC